MEERLKTVIERVVPGVDLTGVTRETRLVEDLEAGLGRQGVARRQHGLRGAD